MRTLALMIPLLFLVGCVQSVHPFYTPDQLTFDRNLVGYWTSTDGKHTLDIPDLDANAEAREYHVTHTDEQGKAGHYVVHLATVGKHTIADTLPEELVGVDSGTYQAQFVPVHSFLVLESAGATLRVRAMQYDWLKKHLEANPAALAHEKIEGDRILLTAPTEKLQAFILQHIDSKEAFGEWTEFKRGARPATQPK